MDGFTYRHLMQDLTMFKTLLLKLRRVVQEVGLTNVIYFANVVILMSSTK